MILKPLLIVEDDDTFRDALLTTLRAGDWPMPVAVATLAAGVLKAEGEQYSAILLDLDLPDSSGIHTVKRMKAAARGVPIIVLSGSSNRQMIADAKLAGASHYIVKDQVSNNLLSDSIRMVIERDEKEKAEAVNARYRAEMQEVIAGLEETLQRLRDSYPIH